MLYPAKIKEANEVLRELDGLFRGSNSRQKFEWRWSSDLWALVPLLDGDGDQRYQILCVCGADVKVHRATCDGIFAARILMEKCYMTEEFGPLASYRDMWVLCRWNPPPSIEDWRSAMGTDVDYPANGRYLPVSKGQQCVVIPPRTPPDEYVPVSRLVVRMMRANLEEHMKAKANATAKRLLPRMDAKGNMIEEPDKDAPFWQIRDRIRNSRPNFDPSATVGYGGKTGVEEKRAVIHQSDRSLADPNGPLAREMRRPQEELRKAYQELAHANSNQRD